MKVGRNDPCPCGSGKKFKLCCGARERSASATPAPSIEQGVAYHQAGDFARAEAVYRQILAAHPNSAHALHYLGLIAHQRERHPEAEELIRRAIRLRERVPEFHVNLGNVLKRLDRIAEAIAEYREALRLRPKYAEAECNLGNMYLNLGRVDQAISHYRAGLRLDPDLPLVQAHLAYVLNLADGVTRAEIHAEHLRWAARHAAPVYPEAPRYPNAADPRRRLRLGYVSPDLRDHPVGLHLLPVLESHDRDRFEVFCYHSSAVSDGVTERLRACSDHWIPCAGLGDDELASRIRGDGVDLLVDLAGHSVNGRLLVFARKPAPVQFTWLGYLNTTGLATMDYRVTDAQVDPPGESERFSTETLVRMPHCQWCYRAPEGVEAPGPLPAQRAGHVTFASLNQFTKVTPRMLALWAGIVARAPGARMLFATVPGDAAEALWSAFARAGVARERVEILGRLPAAEFSRLYQRVDIALDPYTCNGGTTTCESLWAGVPVVTLCGDTPYSRGGMSLLSTIGAPEWVARSEEDYAAIALRLAGDPAALAQVRAGLRGRIAASPLADVPAFTRAMESAYRAAWEKWCASRPAA